MEHRLRDGLQVRARSLAALWFGLVACLCLVPLAASANPSISLSPDKGPIGTSFNVSGEGFGAHSIVTILWDDVILTDLTTSGSGGFSVGLVVPQTDAGAHDVVVRSTAGTASARFVVQGPEPTTTTTTTEPTTTSSSTTSTTTVSTTTTTAPSPTTTDPTTTTAPSPTTTAPSPTTTAAPSPTTTAPSPTTTAAPSPTTTAAPGPTTTVAPGPTTTTPSPTTTTSGPTTTSPTPTTTAPTETRGEQEGPTPTDPDPGDPTTSTTGAQDDNDNGDSSSTDSSVDTTREDSGSASDPTDESTTSTTVTGVTSPMTLPYTSLRESSTGDGPPELTGEGMAIGEFSLTPAAAYPGADLELFFRFDRAIPGLTGVRVMMGGTALGDQIPVNDPSFSVRRTTPDLPPGAYEVTVLSGDLVLATTEFTVLERSASADVNSTPVVVLGVLALVAGLGWRATRNLHGSGAFSGALGPVDSWYAWRERHRR